MATEKKMMVVVGAKTTDFDKAMGNVQKKLNGFSRNMRGLGSNLTGIGRTLTATITAPVVAMAGSLIKTGIEFKAFKQEAKQAFSVLLGDADKAQEHMDKILAFAKTTPFAFPDLISANRKLVSFGMTAEETFPVMDAIGNAVAAMGGGAQELEELADVFAKITANGKITGQELNRLGDKGVNALAIMANKAGVSVDEMREKISKGTIDSKTAIDWLVDGIMNGTDGIAGKTVALGGSLAALKNTWGGAMDSLKAAWRNAGDAIVSDEMFEKIIEGVHKLTDIIKDLPEVLGPVSETLGDMFIGLVDKLAKLIDWFMNLSPETQQFIIKLILLAAAFGPIILVVGKTLIFFGQVSAAISRLVPAFKGIVTIVKVFGRVFGFVFGPVFRILSIFGSVIMHIGGLVVMVLSLIPAWVFIAVAALIMAVVLIIKNWDKIKGFFSNLWDNVKKIFSDAVGAIKGFVTDLWDGVKTTFNNAITAIVDFFQQLPETLAKFFLEDFPYMLGYALGTLARWILDAIQWFGELPGRVWEFLNETWEHVKTWAIETGQAALEAGQTFVENVITFIQTLPGRVWEWLTGTASNIATWASNAKATALETGQSFVENVITFIQTLPSRVWTWLVNTVNNIITWAGNVKTNAVKAGKNLVNGVIDTIKGLPGKVWNILVNTGKKILDIGSTFYENAKKVAARFWDGFKKGLGIASPSYPERAMDDIADRAERLKAEMKKSFGSGMINNLKTTMADIGTVSPTILATAGAGATTMNHTGTIRVEGVNDQGQLAGVVDIVIEKLLQEVRA